MSICYTAQDVQRYGERGPTDGDLIGPPEEPEADYLTDGEDGMNLDAESPSSAAKIDPLTNKPWKGRDWGPPLPPKAGGLPPSSKPFAAPEPEPRRQSEPEAEPKSRPIFVPAVPDYQPFPLAALPTPVKEMVEDVARAVGCDPAYAALPALPLCGAAIGTAVAASPKRGWKQFPALWAVLVADSGTAKTPGAAPFADLAQRLDDAHKPDKGESPDAARASESFSVQDISVERLAEDLQASPRGLLMLHDELANWFGSFTRYKGKGQSSDASRWLSLYEGNRLGVRRKSASPGQPRDFSVDQALVSVSGGIQPGVLREALSNPAYIQSGLAARMNFGMPPKHVPRWNDHEPDPALAEAVSRVLYRLRDIPLAANREPVRFGLTSGARNLWIPWHDQAAEVSESIDGGPMASAMPKLARLSLRLALIHQLVTTAHDGPASLLALLDDMKQINTGAMQAALDLSRWFHNQAERVYAMMAESPEQAEARRLVALIRRKDEKNQGVTPRDLMTANRRKYPNTQLAELALEGLVRDGYGNWQDTKPGLKGGRPTSVFKLRVTEPEPTC